MKRLGEVAATDCCLRNSHSVLILITPLFVYRRANIHHVYELWWCMFDIWTEPGEMFPPSLSLYAKNKLIHTL